MNANLEKYICLNAFQNFQMMIQHFRRWLNTWHKRKWDTLLLLMLTLSGSVVPTSAAKEAVGTWAARMQFWGLTTVESHCWWAPLGAVADCSNAATTSMLAWVLLMRRHKDFWLEAEGGRKCVPADGGVRVTGFLAFLYWFVDALLCSKKLWWGHDNKMQLD